MTGARTMMPQKPRITLGIAASISTSGPMTPRRRCGASRLRNRPIDDADRHAEQQRHGRRHGRPEQQRQRAEPVEVRLPLSAREEAEAELVDRQVRARDDLVGEVAHHDDRDDARERAQRLDEDIAPAVCTALARARGTGCPDGNAHPAATLCRRHARQKRHSQLGHDVTTTLQHGRISRSEGLRSSICLPERIWSASHHHCPPDRLRARAEPDGWAHCKRERRRRAERRRLDRSSRL